MPISSFDMSSSLISPATQSSFVPSEVEGHGFDAVPPDVARGERWWVGLLSAAAAIALLTSSAEARRKVPPPDYAPALPAETAAPTTPGAIFPGASYAPLTSGARASRVGDVLTVVLAERMQATKSNAAKTGRDGSIGLTPPATGPLSFLKGSDIGAGGAQNFAGSGQASQSNALSGEVSVTVIAVRANGTMLVRGQKALTLNRGDEHVQLSGIVRASDIGPDNRVLSTRMADAQIAYTGKGEVARASRQGWLQRFFSAVSPF
jgi:flagellar L-ring protein FlgH